MENNQEIMENNEVLEAAEEIATNVSGLKIVGGAVVIAGVIYGCYKLIPKLKAKKKNVELKAVFKDECEDEECIDLD